MEIWSEFVLVLGFGRDISIWNFWGFFRSLGLYWNRFYNLKVFINNRNIKAWKFKVIFGGFF